MNQEKLTIPKLPVFKTIKEVLKESPQHLKRFLNLYIIIPLLVLVILDGLVAGNKSDLITISANFMLFFLALNFLYGYIIRDILKSTSTKENVFDFLCNGGLKYAWYGLVFAVILVLVLLLESAIGVVLFTFVCHENMLGIIISALVLAISSIFFILLLFRYRIGSVFVLADNKKTSFFKLMKASRIATKGNGWRMLSVYIPVIVFTIVFNRFIVGRLNLSNPADLPLLLIKLVGTYICEIVSAAASAKLYLHFRGAILENLEQ